MNFTREPIIETVITPREGCKLVVRSSKGNNQEDYFVDAVEVVSFGHSFFFRSSERPKSFLVPVSDYEILELKETRMVLKNVTTDRSIKIGGGREAPRPSRDMPPVDSPREEYPAESRPAPASSERPQEQRPTDRKRDKRRRGRRGRDRHEPASQETRDPASTDEHLPSSDTTEGMRQDPAPEVHKAPSFISKLFPPPPTLIKETLSRYKPAEPVSQAPSVQPVEEELLFSEEKETFEETIFEHPESPENTDERDKETHFDD